MLRHMPTWDNGLIYVKQVALLWLLVLVRVCLCRIDCSSSCRSTDSDVFIVCKPAEHCWHGDIHGQLSPSDPDDDCLVWIHWTETGNSSGTGLTSFSLPLCVNLLLLKNEGKDGGSRRTEDLNPSVLLDCGGRCGRRTQKKLDRNCSPYTLVHLGLVSLLHTLTIVYWLSIGPTESLTY